MELQLFLMKVDFVSFRDMCGRLPLKTVLDGKGDQESWLVFRNDLIRAKTRNSTSLSTKGSNSGGKMSKRINRKKNGLKDG